MGKAFDVVVYTAAACMILAAFAFAAGLEQKPGQKAEPQTVVVAVEEKKPAPQSAIHYTSQPGCKPCLAFARNVPELESVGWLMAKRPPDFRGTPAFDVYVGGELIATRTGYSTKNDFYRWLRLSIEETK
jgi:hypothetical protein